MKRYLPFIPVALIIVAGGYFFVQSRDTTYTTAEVTRGAVKQEVLASGNVAPQSVISLQFQTGGRLSAVNVESGDRVSAGQMLAQIDTSVLQAQLAQAQAAVQTQEAQLASLVQGTRPEQIAVTDAQIAADKSAISQAERALVNAIQSAYTQADDAISNKTDPMLNNPHSANLQLAFGTSNSQLASQVLSERLAVESVMSAWAQSFSHLSSSGELIEAAARGEAILTLVSQYLSDLNTLVASAVPNQQTSQATVAGWASSVATARANVNAAHTALTGAVSVQQAAGATLVKDQKTLLLQNAGSTQSSIDAQRALVSQAQANVLAIREQIALARIVAPVSGTVTNVNGDVGETVSPQTTVITMIPDKKLQIDVNLSEDGIARVRTGNPAHITLDAFPGEERKGTVTSIDPAQTIIGGAVYYKTTVVLSDNRDDIRPGMTANVWIQTGESTDALMVPASALNGRGVTGTVQVLTNGAAREREVTTGLRGQDGMVEILSGLTLGELVVTSSR